MKLLVQWTRTNPKDWSEYDSANLSRVPKKPEPNEITPIDNQDGHVHQVNVQGRVISGRDHYAFVPQADGLLVVYWDDDPIDHEAGMFSAFECLIKDPAPDQRIGGAVNARQWLMIYGQAKWLETNENKWTGVRTVSGPVVIRPWSAFVPPPGANTFHGIWTTDELNDEHRTKISVRGWREWIK